MKCFSVVAHFLFGIHLLSAGASAAETDAYGGWKPIGIAGGGSLFAPAISPVSPKRVMINSDMSAAYLSADGGHSWRMIHHAQLGGNTRCRPVFHPLDENTIFAASGWGGKLKVTHDGGQTWTDMGNIQGRLSGEIAIDPGHPERMLAGTEEGAWRSVDGGRTWSRCDGPKGAGVGFHFDQTSPADRRVCFAATEEGVWRSDDSGVTWTKKTAGLPWRNLRAFAGGSNPEEKVCVLYATIPGEVRNGVLAGGVFRSTDRGEQWESCMGEGLNLDVKAADQWAMGPTPRYEQVLTTNAKPLTVYTFNTNTGVKPPHHATVYRSDNAGQTWRAVFHPDSRFGKTNVEKDWRVAGAGQFYQEWPTGAAICPADPDHLLFCGSMGCFITEDGGGFWRAAHGRPAPGTEGESGPSARWICNGLVVTTAWHYSIDPHEQNRHYIAYTDIGLARSLDAGETWTWWDHKGWAPWWNTCYELVFENSQPGKIWGAFSDTHDIPNDNVISGRHKADRPGGVCVSRDFGVTWTASNSGLPLVPVTSLVLEPQSPPGKRILYAGLFDAGVFRSTDDGQTWKASNDGLGAEGNRRVCRLIRHADGTLFALVTAKRDSNGTFLSEGPGLYRSTDHAAHWERVNASLPVLWPKDFAVSPTDSRVIFLGASDPGRGHAQEGGLYRSLNGGKTWELVLRKGPQHFGAYVDARRPDWIYATLCEGAPGPALWLSRDSGETWTAFEDLPFKNIMRVEFDPYDASFIRVCTFGGSVWRGPSEPRSDK